MDARSASCRYRADAVVQVDIGFKAEHQIAQTSYLYYCEKKKKMEKHKLRQFLSGISISFHSCCYWYAVQVQAVTSVAFSYMVAVLLKPQSNKPGHSGLGVARVEIGV